VRTRLYARLPFLDFQQIDNADTEQDFDIPLAVTYNQIPLSETNVRQNSKKYNIHDRRTRSFSCKSPKAYRKEASLNTYSV